MWWILIGTIVLYILFRFYKSLTYWRSLGVSQPTIRRLIFSNFSSICRTKTLVQQVNDLYNIKPNAKYFGTYQFATPALLLRDIDLIKQITVKSFDSFMNHRIILTEEIEPLFGKSLISLKNQQWKDMRSILSPAFTSSKMRMIYILITDCAEQFTKYFVKEAQSSQNGLVTVEMKDIFTRYATDVIGTSAFGVKSNSLEEKENDFYMAGKKATTFDLKGFLKMWAILVMPRLMKLLRINFMDKKITKFFSELILNTIHTREKEGIVRPDMIHLMMEAKKGRLQHEAVSEDAGFATVQESEIGMKEQKLEFTDEDIISQAFLFFFAGYDTASTAMSFMAYEIALQPDIQTKLQSEIDAIIENGRIDYETVVKMKYLDMVVSETLRKWPPGIISERLCEKPYTLETSNENEPCFTIENGITIWIPLYAIHHDEKYFPEPERFDPERFSDENKHKITPFSYIPFGTGPRNCIGSRFALLEIKILFVHLLSKFNLVVIDKTQVPIKLSKKYFNLTPEKGIWLGLKLRN